MFALRAELPPNPRPTARQRRRLRDDDGSVDRALRAVRPAIARLADRVFGGHLLVDVDPETRLVVAVEISFSDLGRPGQHLVDRRREVVLFLNAEGGAG